MGEHVVPIAHTTDLQQLAETDTLTIQLLGKDDLTIDDAETSEQKWRQYIDSFVLVSLCTDDRDKIADAV
jgi:histone deacetylase complex regulatory component SIN3